MSTRRARLFAMLAAALTATAACSSGGGGGPASPTPTPFTPTDCQVLWASDAGPANVVNAYMIQMPVAQWTGGTRAFGSGVSGNLGVLYYHLDLNTAVAQSVAMATTGSFSVQVAGLGLGQSVQVTDPDSQPYADATGFSGAVLATGGTGSFSGVWSDPSPTAPAQPGTGTIAVVFQGSALSLGVKTSYAICFDAQRSLAVESMRHVQEVP